MIKGISIILPVYNESSCIELVLVELYETVKKDLKKYKIEIIVVNDGSSDDTSSKLNRMQKNISILKIIELSRNFGQSAAIACGVDQAKFEIIVLMDSDGQNDPKDIKQLLIGLEKGNDLVSGWRYPRSENSLIRRVPSKIANLVIAKFTGVNIHDFGCTLKAYRASYLKNIFIFGDTHRFLAAYVRFLGGKVTELKVNHRPRISGKSNYTITRTYRVLLDLIFAFVYQKFRLRPLHLFGGFASLFFALAIAFSSWALISRVFFNVWLISTPLPILIGICIGVGFQFLALGIFAELNLRNSDSSRVLKPYYIRAK